MPTRIAFTGKQQVELQEFTPPPLQPDQVRVRTVCSLMSTGTENIVFNRLFEPGTHWDNWVKYPFYPGYANIGDVVAVGPEVTRLKVGDRVAARTGHASEHVVPEARCYPVPDALAPDQAAWFALAKIAFIGARAAQYSLGDSVLVIGAGPIGQMTVRWANAAGCETILVCDSVAGRLEMARVGGATHLIPHPVGEAAVAIREGMRGEGPRVVVDGTGHADVFAHALKVARRGGRVVVLGDTGTPSGQHLTGDLVTRGLTVVGAHDGLSDTEWNDATITRLFFALALSGRFSLDGLTTDVFRPGQCAEAYAAVNARRGETMGVLFDWAEA